MANSYAWAILAVHTKNITSGGTTYTDVIKRVQGTLTATSDASNTTAHAYDLYLNDPADWSAFTAYASISESSVQAWVEARIGSDTITSIKSSLDEYLVFEDQVDGCTAKGTGSGDDFSATFPWS